MNIKLLIAGVGLVIASARMGAGQTPEWHIETGPKWTVEGQIVEPNDISGLAALPADTGLIVSDETRSAQRFRIDRGRHALIIGTSLPLLQGKGKEADLEGITASEDGKWFYATGSHGVSRKSGAVKPDRSHVFRISAGPGNASVEVTSLVPVIDADQRLRQSLGRASEDGGLDIEGIAERKGELFFGLRSPSLAGRASIVQVNAEALFKSGALTAHKTHELALGEGRGIRDLVRVSDGFLLIEGGASHDKSGGEFVLHHWQGPLGNLTRIGIVPHTAGKAEAVLLLEEKADILSVLILYDGVANGCPTELTLRKPLH